MVVNWHVLMQPSKSSPRATGLAPPMSIQGVPTHVTHPIFPKVTFIELYWRLRRPQVNIGVHAVAMDNRKLI